MSNNAFIRAGRVVKNKEGGDVRVEIENKALKDLVEEMRKYGETFLKGKTEEELMFMKRKFTLYGKKFENTPDFVLGSLSVKKL